MAGEKNRGAGVLSVELRDGGDGGGEETGRARGFPDPATNTQARRRAREKRLDVDGKRSRTGVSVA